MLSDQTRAEMEAGARQVHINEGKGSDLPPGYIETLIRTQERMRALKTWQKQGLIEIEWCQAVDRGEKSIRTWTVIRCGDNVFNDIPAEQAGAFPSEVLIANIALALAAGEAKRQRLDEWYG